MKDKEMREFVESLYPYFLEKFKEDGFFKNCVKAKNATVVAIEGNNLKVQFPYDITPFTVRNETGVADLKIGDNVCIIYWIDLKNAVAMFKSN